MNKSADILNNDFPLEARIDFVDYLESLQGEILDKSLCRKLAILFANQVGTLVIPEENAHSISNLLVEYGI